MRTLTQKYLREILVYDKETGLFLWKKAKGSRTKQGKEAGFLNKVYGYKYISIDGKQYRNGRLAWLYVYGKWPKAFIDHINHNTVDDRIDNLREATPLQNQANRRINKNSTSGFKGVTLFKKTGKWRAMIACTHIGYYSTPEEAHAAYVAAAEKRHSEFACPR